MVILTLQNYELGSDPQALDCSLARIIIPHAFSTALQTRRVLRVSHRAVLSSFSILAAAFADAGADLLFIDALASEQEMRAFTGLGGAAAGLPKARALSTLQGIFACVLWHQQMPQDARSFVSCHCSPLPHSRISLQ